MSDIPPPYNSNVQKLREAYERVLLELGLTEDTAQGKPLHTLYTSMHEVLSKEAPPSLFGALKRIVENAPDYLDQGNAWTLRKILKECWGEAAGAAIEKHPRGFAHIAICRELALGVDPNAQTFQPLTRIYHSVADRAALEAKLEGASRAAVNHGKPAQFEIDAIEHLQAVMEAAMNREDTLLGRVVRDIIARAPNEATEDNPWTLQAVLEYSSTRHVPIDDVHREVPAIAVLRLLADEGEAAPIFNDEPLSAYLNAALAAYNNTVIRGERNGGLPPLG